MYERNVDTIEEIKKVFSAYSNQDQVDKHAEEIREALDKLGVDLGALCNDINYSEAAPWYLSNCCSICGGKPWMEFDVKRRIEAGEEIYTSSNITQEDKRRIDKLSRHYNIDMALDPIITRLKSKSKQIARIGRKELFSIIDYLITHDKLDDIDLKQISQRELLAEIDKLDYPKDIEKDVLKSMRESVFDAYVNEVCKLMEDTRDLNLLKDKRLEPYQKALQKLGVKMDYLCDTIDTFKYEDNILLYEDDKCPLVQKYFNPCEICGGCNE